MRLACLRPLRTFRGPCSRERALPPLLGRSSGGGRCIPDARLPACCRRLSNTKPRNYITKAWTLAARRIARVLPDSLAVARKQQWSLQARGAAREPNKGGAWSASLAAVSGGPRGLTTVTCEVLAPSGCFRSMFGCLGCPHCLPPRLRKKSLCCKMHMSIWIR